MEGVADRSQAQRRVDRIRTFREELERLLAEGAVDLTPGQKQRLDQHLEATLKELAVRFDVDTTESQKRFSWGVRIASTIAGLALCAAAVLFFFRNWGLLSLPAQIAILIAAPLVLIAATEYSSRHDRGFYYTVVLGIVAFAAAVLNVNALGAMFNLPASESAFLVWAVFGLALAYAYRIKLLLAAGLVCAVIFANGAMLRLAGLDWTVFDSRIENIILAGAVILAVPAIVDHRKIDNFSWTYEVAGLTTVLLALLMGSLNGDLTYLPFAKRTVEIGYQLIGLAVAAAAMWQGVARRKPAVLNIGAAAFALFLYIRLYQWWWDWIPKYLFFLSIGLIALAFLYLFQRIRTRRSS